jgi:hypothetical protein
MTLTLPPFAEHHWIILGVSAWLMSNVAAAMPSPSDQSSSLYKTLFTFMHLTFGSVPRIIATLLPAQYQKLLGNGNGNGGPK